MLIDDDALISALQSGQVAAGLLAMENVVLLPHLGCDTVETRDAMGHLVLDEIDALLAGKMAGNLVKIG